MTPQTALDSSPLSALVGNSSAMKRVHKEIVRMSRQRFPVLILGETGTGKEVAARALHALGNKGPFVVVDCSSLVGPLMESEIFGYVRGAFTGAQNNKLGLLDAANGGTAFFDEIGELPLDLQMKLLRVLQEKQFRPVGSLAVRQSNFRIVAATHRNLETAVAENRFRQDLYYRFNVMKLRMPSLRERKEDIPVLLSHFLQRHGNGHRVPDEVMDMLCEYPWPGNVRELDHAVQAMVAMNTGTWLSVADLPTSISNRLSELRSFAGAPTPPETNGVSLAPVVPLEEVVEGAIRHALRVTRGDRTMAANLLGIGRTTLYRKLKEYVTD